MQGFFLLALTVVVLAIFGAGIFPWFLHFSAIVMCLGCVVLPTARPSGKAWLPFLAASGLVLFVLLTIVPLPPALDFVVGHDRAAQDVLVRNAIHETAALGLTPDRLPWFSLTRNRAGSIRILLLLLTAMGAAGIASRLPDDWKGRYMRFLVLAGTIVAAAGFLSQWLIPQQKMIWWFFPVAHGQPVGCFVNRNHFGGFIAMLCGPTAALLAASVSRKAFRSGILWAGCLGIMSTAVVMSLSRGAWLACGAAGLVILALWLLRGQVLRAAAMVLVLAAVFCLVSRLPYIEELDERAASLENLQEDASAQLRLHAWRDALRILPDYAFCGVGANGFRMIFPQYRTSMTRKSFRYAENEYIQIPVEIGLIGSLIVIAMFAGLLLQWRSGSAGGAVISVVGWGVGASLLVAGFHAMFDFALRVPLYLMVFASLLGLVIVPPPLPARRIGTARAPFRLAAAAGLILTLLMFPGGSKVYERDDPDFIRNADVPELCGALAWSPTSWHAWYHLGRGVIVSGAPGSVQLGERHMLQATAYDPNNYLLWEALGTLRADINDINGVREANAQIERLGRAWARVKEP